MKKTTVITYFLAGAIALNLANCSKKNEQPTENTTKEGMGGVGVVSLTQKQMKGGNIQMSGFSRKPLTETIVANGYLKVPPQNMANVSCLIAGTVNKIHVIEGALVAIGTPLAELSSLELIQLQEEYLKSKSAVRFLESEQKRQQELAAANAGIQKTFQKTEADLSAEKAHFEAILKQLSLLKIPISDLDKGNITPTIQIYSPIGGYIKDINATIGAHAQNGESLFEIVDNHHIHVDLMVYEKDIARVQINQKILFRLPNLGNKETEGVIFAVGKSVDAVNKTIAVHAEIDNSEKLGLMPGMFVTGKIVSKTENTRALPETALLKANNADYIFARIEEENDTAFLFQMVQVQTGSAENGWVAVEPLDNYNFDSTQIVINGVLNVFGVLKGEESGGE